jgi:hypothetical protein
MRQLFLAAALALAAAAPLTTAGAERQSIALRVSDAQGAFVADLRADEVRVLENGEARELLRFERDERPLAVALVLDTSTGAARVFRGQSRDAVAMFVAELPPGTSCTLWATADHPRRVGELRGAGPELEKQVAQGFGLDGPNALLDTLVEAAAALGRESGRRRALVAVSGAGAGHTNLSPSGVLGKVRRASAPVFGILYREGSNGSAGPLVGFAGPRDAANLSMVGPDDHERILLRLGQATGGRFEPLVSASGAGHALHAFAADLAGQYRVSYASAPTSKARRVELRVERPGVRWHIAVDSP